LSGLQSQGQQNYTAKNGDARSELGKHSSSGRISRGKRRSAF
jgi:hypothetical protein